MADTTRTLIAIPCMDMIPVPFFQSMMNLRKTNDTAYAINANSLIYDSRNTFVANAIEKGYDRILWLDSDMVFEPDLLERLNADMDEINADMVCGLFFKRHMPTGPVVYKRLEYGMANNGRVAVRAEPYTDYPPGGLFEVQGCGFGAVLCKTELLKNVWDKFGPPFDPMTQIGEDLACCWRIRKYGATIYCDSRVKVGHVGQFVYNEALYVGQKQSGSNKSEGA